MSKIPPLGRSRSRRPPPAPPRRARSPSPSPLSDSDPDPDLFDPNRTPPPPGVPIFHDDIPEQKIFEIPPLRQLPAHALRPLTGRPPDPNPPTGVKNPKGSGSKKKARAGRRATAPADTIQDPLEVLQTSLNGIQSYLDTLTAYNNQQTVQHLRPQNHPSSEHPRANPIPTSPPKTLADLISTPQRSRKR